MTKKYKKETSCLPFGINIKAKKFDRGEFIKLTDTKIMPFQTILSEFTRKLVKAHGLEKNIKQIDLNITYRDYLNKFGVKLTFDE